MKTYNPYFDLGAPCITCGSFACDAPTFCDKKEALTNLILYCKSAPSIEAAAAKFKEAGLSDDQFYLVWKAAEVLCSVREKEEETSNS